MGKIHSWLPLLLVAFAAAAAVAVGLGATDAFAGSGGKDVLAPGSVVHTIAKIGIGPDQSGSLVEVSSEDWVLIGKRDSEESRRGVLTNGTGTTIQEGLWTHSSGVSRTLNSETGDVITAERPLRQSALMWTEQSIRSELLDAGFVRVGETEIAGIPAAVYELDSHELGEFPPAIRAAGGFSASDVHGIVRRVFVGLNPFGADLGEEAGYTKNDGSQFLPYYRHVTNWEVLESAPPGIFEWSPELVKEGSR